MDERIQVALQILGAITLLGGGGLLAWRQFPFFKTKTIAEVKELDAKADNTLALTVANLGVELSRINGEMSRLRQQYRDLENEFEKLKDQHEMRGAILSAYRKGVKVLIKQITALGAKPDWNPPD